VFQTVMSSNDKPRRFHMLLIPRVSQQFSFFSKVRLFVWWAACFWEFRSGSAPRPKKLWYGRGSLYPTKP